MLQNLNVRFYGIYGIDNNVLQYWKKIDISNHGTKYTNTYTLKQTPTGLCYHYRLSNLIKLLNCIDFATT